MAVAHRKAAPVTRAAAMASSSPQISKGWWRGAAAVLLALAGQAPARAQVLNFTNYSGLEGVPQAQVLTVYQDRQGFIWLGTYGGLTRFDGVEFRTYTRREGLSSNVVTAITQDAGGRLVIGTVGGGVCRRSEDAFRCLGTADGLPDADVWTLAADPAGGVWVGTERGLAWLDSTGTIHAYGQTEGLPGLHVHRVLRDRAGVIWVATDRGVARMEAGRFVLHPAPELRGADVVVLVELPDGLLVGTAHRLFRWREGQLAPVTGLEVAAGRPFTSAARDGSGTLWISTRFGAIRYREGATVLLTRGSGLPDDNINDVTVDREGNVWFGTESGLSKLTPGPFSHYTTQEGLPHPFVRVLLEDAAGRLWAGTRDGVAVFDGTRFQTRPLPNAPDRRIYGMAALPDGSLLLGTRIGLIHYHDGVRRIYRERDGLPSDWVTSLLADSAGQAWIGTASGMARWDSGRIQPVRDSLLETVFATTLAFDRRGRLWIGRRAGGVAILDGDRVTTLGADQGLSDQPIWTLATDRDGGMWAGTNGDGAFRVAPDGTIRTLSAADGLVSDFVWQVLVDPDDRVWLFTGLGLDRYREGRIEHFGRDDGLIELEGSAAAAWRDRHGDLWFGTGAGAVRYVAAREQSGGLPPPVYVEEITAGGKPLAGTGNRVAPGAGVVRIRFASPSFRNPAGVRYRYRLLGGGSEEWSDLRTERSVAFVGLHPGEYVFEVEAADEDGQASREPARLAFTILPAFWQTWWFRAIAIVVLAGLAALIPWVRTRRLRWSHERLEQQVAQHTRTLAEQNARLASEVAERIAAEEALRRKEEQLRDVLENSTNLFYSHTEDGVLTYVSPQSRQFFGADPDDVVGLPAGRFITDHPHNDMARASVARAFQTGEKQPPYELELWGPDRQRLWVQVNEAPVVRDGRTVALVGSLTNITETKAAQAAEERLEAQLRQAQKMEAVGRLAGGIAHDFNNLLTAVVGHAELAMDALPPDNPVHTDLGVIRRAADRAASLVAQLLAFSRQQMVKRRPLDLNVVAAETARMLQRILGSDVALALELSPHAPWILADHGQLDQVLLNLAVNARDAMPTGGRLTISTGAIATDQPLSDDAPAGSYVVLEVADTGEGMDAETRARAFEPFFTTKGVGKGTGLGLAMVYGIVKQNGGHVSLESEVGQGTTFRIYFPRIQPPRDPATALPALPPSRLGGRDRVVLVVEDEDSVRRLVCQTLTRSGYRVLEAPDGGAALEVSARFSDPIHLLLSDMIMPGMNGRQVATRITERRQETRVLFMSGHADGVLGRNGLIEEEGTQLIRKPFTPAELASRVEELLA